MKIKRQFQNKFGRILANFDDSTNDAVEIVIHQDIGEDPWTGEGFTSNDLRELTKDIDRSRPLDIRLNSPGGSVWDGFAIKTYLDEWPGRVTASVDGMAASTASWICSGADEIRAPRHAQMFIHQAWGMVMGNADDMEKQANDLRKATNQIAGIYARHNRKGLTEQQCLKMMEDETLMTGEEMLANGFIDRLTDDTPVANFTETQIRNMKSKLAILNKIPRGKTNNSQIYENMNRKQKIAWLNKNGISVSSSASDEFVNKMISALSPAPEFKNGKDGEHAKSCKCVNCHNEMEEGEKKKEDDDDEPENAGEPSAEGDGADHKVSKGESEEYKAATEQLKQTNKQMQSFLANQRKQTIQNKLDKFVQDGRIPANSLNSTSEKKGWLDMALSLEGDDETTNPILNTIAQLPQAHLPGIAPLNITVEDPNSLSDVDRAIQHLMKPANYFSVNRKSPESLAQRIEIGNNSKKVQQLVNRLKKYNKAAPKGLNASLDEASGGPALEGPLRQAWDNWAAGGPRNANTMSTQLLRQVILSEVMRAFRRQFASLEIFCHNFQSVPLEGTDYIEVPYYPLDTVASTEFTYANGYVVAANAQTLYKQIYVGGVGNGVATPGSGRKYKPLQFTAYEIRRQPWLDIQKLSVMAGEQLAIDVRADIFGTLINAANFGNAIWTGAANGFDHSVIGNVAMQAAISAFWPQRGRNIVLAPGYYSNLAIDPGLYPFLMSGGTDILNEGIIKNKYGFENIFYDALLPVANSIRGGDGAAAPGTDPNLAGFMAWPSALLVATAPIMPPPGVLKKLVAYEQITDDQTGLAFTYQFWGDEAHNYDNEIIECTYGSGLGLLQALFRFTSQGN
ncbi:MAG: Clp protease ClpP [Patescibacteria group bacterium]|nr:Clp protease ClpP [Patescibacteria group bacterium]